MSRRSALVGFLFAACISCIDRQTARKAIEGIQGNGVTPDEMPVMLNREAPFRYPSALYAERVQGNVTLRIHVDSTGALWPDSTAVIESSGYSALDSAAVQGSRELRFTPARLHGRPMAVSLLLPVYFRHPRASPLPGDTILEAGARKQGSEVGKDSSESGSSSAAVPDPSPRGDP